MLSVKSLIHASNSAEFSTHGTAILMFRGTAVTNRLCRIRVNGTLPLFLPVKGSSRICHLIIEIAGVFRANIVDVGKNTLTIEATGTESKLDALEDLFRSYGIRQLTRTGKIAMSRGHDQ